MLEYRKRWLKKGYIGPFRSVNGQDKRMGGVFENLGTTLNISEPPRVSFAPPRVLLGLWRVFCNLGSMCKKSGQSQNVKCDLKSRHLENK